MRAEKKYVLLLLAVACLGEGCKKKTDDPVTDNGYNYFPVNTGHELVYDVDSIVYDDNTGSTTIDSFAYQYKEVITADITDDTGKPAQKVERFFRNSDTDTWYSANSWVISRDELTAQKVTENVRYVKLVFPLNERKTWDGNAYNGKGAETYSIDFFDQPFAVNGNTFEKATKVLQTDEVNAIEEITRYEVYARDVGMVYLQSDSINTQPKPTGGSKSRGFRYKLRLRSYQ